MKHLIFLFLLLLFIPNVSSQNIKRVEVSGKIITTIEDKQNITIYNTSSNKGTITDSLGQFKIKVAVNDEIKVAAIQLKNYKTRVTQQVIDKKQLNLYLKEKITSLEEVILLQYDLTGDIKTDVENVAVVAPISKGSFSDIGNMEVPDDHHSKVDNIAVGTQNDRQRFQANGMAIINLLVNAIFKNKNKKQSKEFDADPKFEIPISKLAILYKNNYYSSNYNIPEDKVQEFINYLEAVNFDYTLLKPNNEIELIEYLHKKSTAFLKQQNAKQ